MVCVQGFHKCMLNPSAKYKAASRGHTAHVTWASTVGVDASGAGPRSLALILIIIMNLAALYIVV